MPVLADVTLWHDAARWRSFDTETPKFEPGRLAPPIVCSSVGRVANGTIVGELVVGQARSIEVLREYLANGSVLFFANAPYDLAVAAAADPTLLPLIFAALDENRIYDVSTAEVLNAIYHGTLGKMPDGSELRSPTTGKPCRYNLEVVTYLVLGRVDAKKNDQFRKSYSLLADFPEHVWPNESRIYPADDAANTLEVAAEQIFGKPGRHAWVTEGELTVCRLCRKTLDYSSPISEACPSAPREPHCNLGNLPAQVRSAFALHLGAAHSLRTDAERVAKLSVYVEEKYAAWQERFKNFGWIRAEDGSEDQRALKKSIVEAYGGSEPCPRCNGTGAVRRVQLIDCRGEKVKGRYRGCLGDSCPTCNGTRQLRKLGNEVTCKNEFDEDGALIERGCDGSGFHLDSVPNLPRSDKLGVKTDRDTLMESGNEHLAEYGEDEWKKSKSTYLPYLARGIHRPLSISANVLVATGRCSYEGCPVHQFPRSGFERECIRARGAWCGYPIEMVLGSTDYSAGELCTLAQFTYWLFKKSRMRDAINESGNPGILHSDLAAEVIGISLDDFLKRLKAKDKQAVDFRQMCKPINFGVPGGMGVPKLVYTSRKKNAGFTVCERGPARNEKDQPGYWGVRFCVLMGTEQECGIRKVTKWKDRDCPPVCEACLKVVDGVLKPAYLKRYPEIKEYFAWAKRMIDSSQPAPSLLYDRDADAVVVVRERGGCDFPAFCNNGFQSMLSDIGKWAHYEVTRECYLGVKRDGSPSPLAGCRVPLYLHDEPLTELIAETAHLSGPRVAEIMVEAGERFAPDVVWKAETALAFIWNKAMEPETDASGKLIPWDSEEAIAKRKAKKN